MDKETLCTIALSQISGIGNNAITLYNKAGGASVILDNHQDVCSVVSDCNPKLAKLIDNGFLAAMERAKREADFVDNHAMKALPYNAMDFPERLRECADPPLLLYYSGNANLNAKRIVCIVGTRKCTAYGRDLCKEFITDLQKVVPDCLVVSGLAYGIDVCAHTNAMDNGLPTVGVLAHGLEKIYPALHRPIAVKMTRNGGLLTEYITNTVIEKSNFLKRNRIVAGISDATIVVESADRGGSLVTAKIANSYGREVFAFPGRVYDEMSRGCNRLIRTNMAMCLTSADDFVKAMNWDRGGVSTGSKQMELFPELNEEQQKIVNVLKERECMSGNELSQALGVGLNVVSSLLFDLEMSGVIAAAGSLRYRLVRRNV